MILVSKESCTGCAACYSACPFGAISMKADEEGFLHPLIDNQKCTNCGKCARSCPIINRFGKNSDNPDSGVLAFAAKSSDDSIRKASSSGGLFTEIAKSVLAHGGIVFGCTIEDGTLKAIHSFAETIEALGPLRRSKYVQSDIRDSFRNCRKFLDDGKCVLFVGTPCQIAGLYSYLGNRPDNLLTVDLFCHGVPSPSVFEKFKEELEKRGNSRLTSIAFRVKVSGEKWPVMEYGFEDPAKNCRENNYTTSFYKAFINDLCLRPCCHGCQFNGGRSGADMTIADFRGLEWERPDLCDETGVSALLVRSEKGKDVIRALTSIERHPVGYEQISANSRSYHNTARKVPKGRTWFMGHFRKMELSQCVALAISGGAWYRRLACGFSRELGKVSNKVRQIIRSFKIA